MSSNFSSWSRRALLGSAAGILAASAAGRLLAAPAGQPIRVGSTLALTGPLAQTALIYKIVGEIFVDGLNKANGLLGRPVEWVLYDDQSKPDVARSLYEKLLAQDKVDLIVGPYATGAILSAVGVAQRHNKLFIQGSLGMPHLVPYEMAFPATPFGPEPNKSYPAKLLDMMATAPNPPKSITILTSKFPSAQYWSAGARQVAEARGLKVPLYLEYEFGNRDFSAIAARVKEANADFLWVGALGLEGNQLLEAMKKLDYQPKRHFYLFPAPGPMAVAAEASNAFAQGTAEEHAPFTNKPAFVAFANEFRARATKAGLPNPNLDSQAISAYVTWELLTKSAEATKSIDDKKMADWLRGNAVDTIIWPMRFDGKFNHGPDQQTVRQLQDGKWVVVWPSDFAPPGVKPRF